MSKLCIFSGIFFSGRWSYPVAVKETFDLICLLNSTNRKTAYAYVKLIDQLMADRRIQLSLLPEDVRLNTLQDLGKLSTFILGCSIINLVTAALNHPAFSVDQCMRFEQARDELLMQYERIRPVTGFFCICLHITFRNRGTRNYQYFHVNLYQENCSNSS